MEMGSNMRWALINKFLVLNGVGLNMEMGPISGFYGRLHFRTIDAKNFQPSSGRSVLWNGYWTLCSSCMWMDVCMSMCLDSLHSTLASASSRLRELAEDKSKRSRRTARKSSILCILPLWRFLHDCSTPSSLCLWLCRHYYYNAQALALVTRVVLNEVRRRT